MVTEDYVSFETAKILKEKGFNENTKSYYVCEDNDVCVGYVDGLEGVSNSELEEDFCARPTLQMAMKWLREVHNLRIVVFPYDNSALPYIWYIFANNGDKPNKANSYEEACEAAIKYCLENLT